MNYNIRTYSKDWKRVLVNALSRRREESSFVKARDCAPDGEMLITLTPAPPLETSIIHQFFAANHSTRSPYFLPSPCISSSHLLSHPTAFSSPLP